VEQAFSVAATAGQRGMTSEETMTVLRFLVERDMAIDKFYFDTDNGIVIAENCNDLFFWACADAEDITPSDLPMLEQAIKDCEAVGSCLSAYAGTIYACRKRGMRPQNPCYSGYPKDLWPLLDAAGPERDEKSAGSRKRAEEKYDARQNQIACATCKGTGRVPK
jgi:hypothetical protein